MKIRITVLFLLVCSHLIAMESPSRKRTAPEISEPFEIPQTSHEEPVLSQQLHNYFEANPLRNKKQLIIEYYSWYFNVLPEIIRTILEFIDLDPMITESKEISFKSLYWGGPEGRALRTSAEKIKKFINQGPLFATILENPFFTGDFAWYITLHYKKTPQLRAVIGLGLPGAELWIKKMSEHMTVFNNQWCQELDILSGRLDAATALHEPFYENRIKLLLRALPKENLLWKSADSCIRKLFFHAVRGNYQQLAKLMINKGVEVNMLDSMDQPPLLSAVVAENIPMIKLLMDAGARGDIPSIYKQTPLDFANMKPNSERKNEIIELLTGKGAEKK